MFILHYGTWVVTGYQSHGIKTNGSIEQDERMEDIVEGKWQEHASPWA